MGHGGLRVEEKVEEGFELFTGIGAVVERETGEEGKFGPVTAGVASEGVMEWWVHFIRWKRENVGFRIALFTAG